jgi:hypothetical protein
MFVVIGVPMMEQQDWMREVYVFSTFGRMGEHDWMREVLLKWFHGSFVSETYWRSSSFFSQFERVIY